MLTASIPTAPDADASSGLYARLLGAAWLQLAEPVRFAHRTESIVRASGRLRIARGRGYGVRILAAVLRMPREHDAAGTRLAVTARGEVEEWLRTFDNRCLATRQYQTGDRELGERIGFLEFRFRLDVRDGSLIYQQVAAAFLCGPVRVRLPAALAPRVEAREDPAGDHRVRINVRVILPALGPLLTYDGIVNFEEPRH